MVLETIPFEPPRGGTMLENYLVNYDMQRGSATYKSSYTYYMIPMNMAKKYCTYFMRR
jgi:hypothetical protein